MSSPFDSPGARWGIAFSGAAVMVAVALLFMEGPPRYVLLAFALVDFVVTPRLLKGVATQ